MKKIYHYAKIHLFFLMSMLVFSSTGFGAKNQEEPKGYPIDSDVFTTLQRTVVPDPKPAMEINLNEISKYKK